jgi:hypothetical protein
MKENKEELENKVIEKVDEKIKNILDTDITTTNLDHLYKLSKIKHMAKEDKEMYGEYGNYGRGRRPGYDSYGRDEYGRGGYVNYGENYGRRGRDMRYRGDDYLERMSGEYGRYEESRNRYGAGKESDEAYRYMTESLKDFTKYLFETADTPQQKQMLREALQSSMM